MQPGSQGLPDSVIRHHGGADDRVFVRPGVREEAEDQPRIVSGLPAFLMERSAFPPRQDDAGRQKPEQAATPGPDARVAPDQRGAALLHLEREG